MSAAPVKVSQRSFLFWLALSLVLGLVSWLVFGLWYVGVFWALLAVYCVVRRARWVSYQRRIGA